MFKKIILSGALTMLLVSGATMGAAAQTGGIQSAPSVSITSLTDIQVSIICKVVDWMFGFLVVLTILFVMIAAFRYLFDQGKKPEEIHKMLIYAAVAIVVALLAKGFPMIVSSFFSDSTAFTGC